MKRQLIIALSLLLSQATFVACDDKKDEPVIKREPSGTTTLEHRQVPDFVYGADPGWVTAMEDSKWDFKDADGKKGDCLEILKGIGFDACRLRVWVNPTDGYCGMTDMIKKAKRAFELGYTIMIDFHYSDQWADPAQKYKPSIWDACTSVDEMAQMLEAYTRKVLKSLYANDVDVAWVQIGNETANGMIMTNSDGSSTTVNGSLGANYVKLHSAGCKAVKEVFPQAKTVMHFQNGQSLSKMTYALDILKKAGIEFDILGVSLYPDYSKTNWYAEYVDACVNNLNSINKLYGCDVMVCEVGSSDIESDNAKIALADVYRRCREEVPSCRGVFYWEPECYNGWSGYQMGGFTSDGRPSEALINALKK